MTATSLFEQLGGDVETGVVQRATAFFQPDGEVAETAAHVEQALPRLQAGFTEDFEAPFLDLAAAPAQRIGMVTVALQGVPVAAADTPAPAGIQAIHDPDPDISPGTTLPNLGQGGYLLGKPP